MALEIIDGPYIVAGESLSDVRDCRAGELVRITMSATWTPAPMTFQMSSDGEGFNNLCDYRGEEVTINVVPGSMVLIPFELARAVAFIKLRSGSSKNPVPQENGAQFALAIKVPDTGPV